MIEKRFLHPAAIAVKIVRRQAEVFVRLKVRTREKSRPASLCMRISAR